MADFDYFNQLKGKV